MERCSRCFLNNVNVFADCINSQLCLQCLNSLFLKSVDEEFEVTNYTFGNNIRNDLDYLNSLENEGIHKEMNLYEVRNTTKHKSNYSSRDNTKRTRNIALHEVIKQDHKITQQETEYFECKQCEIKCRYKKNLRRHIKNKHGNLPLAKMIPKTTTVKTKWRPQQENDFECKQCKIKYKYKRGLQSHIKIKHGNLPLAEIIPKTTTVRTRWRPSVLKNHAGKTVHKSTKIDAERKVVTTQQENEHFECKQCKIKYKYKRGPQRHVKITHGNLPLDELLPKTPTVKTKWRPQQENDFECKQCKIKYKYKRNLRRHVKKRHGNLALAEMIPKTTTVNTKWSPSVLKNHAGKTVYKSTKINAERKVAITQQEKGHFECKQCKIRYKYKRGLRSHVKVKHGNLPLDEMIPKTTTVKKKWRPQQENDFECKQCKIKYKYKRGLRSHVKIKHGNLPLAEMIPKTTTVKTKWRTSVLKNHVGKTAYKSTKIDSERKVGITQKENDHFECKQCKIKYKYKRGLQRHVKTKHGNLALAEMIPKTTTVKTKWRPQQENDFECKPCKIKYKYKRNLRRHVKKRHGNLALAEMIPKTTTVKTKWRTSVLKNHAGKTVHNSIKIDAKRKVGITQQENDHFECKQCQIKYKYKRGLQSHIKIKHGNLPLAEMIPKTTTVKTKWRPSVLKKHKSTKIDAKLKVGNTQQDIGNFECKQCKIKYKYKRGLRSHVKIKHGNLPLAEMASKTTTIKKKWRPTVKTHECYFCLKKFNNKKDLTRHFLATHTDFKVFKCQLCPLAYKYKHGLSRHCQKFHEIPPQTYELLITTPEISCEICNMKCSDETELQLHAIFYGHADCNNNLI